jgi:hypothetical protein
MIDNPPQKYRSKIVPRHYFRAPSPKGGALKFSVTEKWTPYGPYFTGYCEKLQ